MRVWTADPRALADADLERAARRWLPPEELAAIDRIVVAGRRHETLATRALTRWALGEALGRRPEELAFAVGPHGKPALAEATALAFNATNAAALVACAVAPEAREVGVDVEPRASAERIATVDELVFTDEERAEASALDASERARDLVERWTLKEAYMKARGLGFALAPLSFALATRPSPRLLRVDDGDAAARWSLTMRWVDDHAVAVCADAASDVSCARVALAAILGGR